MPRTESAPLTEIFKASTRRDTLDVYLSNNTILKLSRGAVLRDDHTYQNWISSVGELTQTIDSDINRIEIKCQNIDSQMGLTLASNLRLLDYALCDYGRIYQSARNPALIEDIPQYFRGVMANAEADEKRFKVELIVDYESLGSILASRGLSPRCWWGYKNGIECTSTSDLPTCPHTRDGCIERDAEKDFGGNEFFEEPMSSLPSSGGGGGGIGDYHPPCFTGDTLVWTPDGDFRIDEMLERLKAGKSSVFSFDKFTGEIIEDEIEKVWRHDNVKGYFTFTFEHAELNITPDHRLFRSVLKQFSVADKFKVGDTIKRESAKSLTDSKLLNIKWNSDVSVTVWNLRVKKNRTYFANRSAVSNRKDDTGFDIPY